MTCRPAGAGHWWAEIRAALRSGHGLSGLLQVSLVWKKKTERASLVDYSVANVLKCY